MRRRGISFGTVFMLLLTIGVLGVSAVMLPRLAGKMDQRVDAQQIANAITSSLDLPELSLSDIPIFPQAVQPAGPAVTPPVSIAGDSEFFTQGPLATENPAATVLPSKQTFTITAGGIISFDASVRKSAYHSESKTYDFTSIFSYLSGAFTSDLCLATLENTIVDNGKLNDVNVTADILPGLTTAGLDMIALGHEHALDLGLEGLVETAAAVRGAGFTALGIQTDKPSDGQAGQTPLIVNLKGIQVAFLHYADLVSNAGKKAMKSDAAAYALPIYSQEAVVADIQAARSQGGQVVVVLIHWGQNEPKKVTADQQEKAQAIADAGADILLGAHGNAVLPMEYLTGNRADGTKRPTLVCYSMGTLLTGNRDLSEGIAGALLHLTITYDSGTGIVAFDGVQYTPTYVWRYRQDGQYYYRVVQSDKVAPADMDSDQQKVMQRALERITQRLADSPAKPRAGQ